MASKWSILLVGVSGRWLITDSILHRNVLYESSVNARSRAITLNTCFTDLTKDLQISPIHRLTKVLNFHYMFFLLITSIIFS